MSMSSVVTVIEAMSETIAVAIAVVSVTVTTAAVIVVKTVVERMCFSVQTTRPTAVLTAAPATAIRIGAGALVTAFAEAGVNPEGVGIVVVVGAETTVMTSVLVTFTMSSR